MSDQLRGYAHRVDIAADVDRVWLALTQPANLTRWCSPDADIRARPGGLFRASVDRVIELEAHIDVYEPARRLRLIYLPSSQLPPADSPIIDDFILDSTTPGTIVRLLGSGIPSTPDWDAQYKRLRLGWQAAMTRLKVFVERQLGKSE
ncbi:MAG: SRPBCC family protein [Steroidobacteraceae bacterium]